MPSLVKKLRPDTAAPGEIVDARRPGAGRASGLVHFTIGQRRGIEIGGQAEPLYVVRIEPEEQRVVVGPSRALAVERARVEGVNWLGEGQPEGCRPRSARWRRRCRRDWMARGSDFDTPEYGVAPGQSAVLYDGERLLGGGTIVATNAAEIAATVAA